MSTTAFTVDAFGGLNVAEDPATLGPSVATDILNVDLDQVGRIRARAGYSLVKGFTVTSTDGLAAFETTPGTRQIVVSHTTSGTRAYEAYASTGGALVATAAPGSTILNAVRWGEPTNEYLYIGNGTDTIWRWSGAAFSQPAGMPTATFLAVSPSSNRLVTACLSGLTSRVLFSDAGAPETFTYNTAPTPDTGNYVDLAPGDGSPITGAVAWQNDVYVFKRGRFFVFYGEDTDADGQPIFRYRPVDTYGSIVPPAAGDEGVYFYDGRTIWVTTGGVPRRVSRPIEPILRGATIAGLSVPSVSQGSLSSARLFYSLGRLFVKVPTASGFVYTLVYDPKVDAWTIYLTATPFEWATTVNPAGTDQKFTYFFGLITGGGVSKFDPTLTQDPGSNPVVWQWTGGWTDMGEPARVKVTLESRLWGVGSVSLNVATDYGNLANPAALTLGTSPTVADAWQQIDYEGTLWRTGFIGASWGGVDRFAHYVSFTKPAGVQ